MTTTSLAPSREEFGPPDFTLAGPAHVAYRVSLAGPLAAGRTIAIQREARGADGEVVVRAAALARWGARVRLELYGIGDDAHGRFLERELATWPNLQVVARPEPGLATPYAIVLRGADGWISVLTNHWPNDAAAGDTEAPGTGGLTLAVHDFAGWKGARLPEKARNRASEAAQRVLEIYREGFGGLESIPGREELEAAFEPER